MYREMLAEFDAESLPTLDTAVLGALELFVETPPPVLPVIDARSLLVCGSGNASVVGRLLFEDRDVWLADESTYMQILERHTDQHPTAVLISASGGKDAIPIATELKRQGIDTWLLTNNPEAPACAVIDASRVCIFPKNREPYTYNTSTYMGMVLAKTHEDPQKILSFITDTLAGMIPRTLKEFDSFFFILPPQYISMKDMLLTKFDELFGGRISARAFTTLQARHAKTVVSSPTEYFVSFGEENTLFGTPETRVHIPLPAGAGYGAMMAIGYYLIGNIQTQHPAYFFDAIGQYATDASSLFGETIHPIVE